MPRPVVPMFSPSDVLLSSARSSAKCQGKMTWARSLIRRLSAWPAPRLASSSSSSITRAGLITTPVRDDARDAGRENAAGQQRELVDLVADDDGMPGVRAALVADDEVVLTGQEVDDLALGFVAPLQTDNASAGHSETVRGCAKKGGMRGHTDRSHATAILE